LASVRDLNDYPPTNEVEDMSLNGRSSDSSIKNWLSFSFNKLAGPKARKPKSTAVLARRASYCPSHSLQPTPEARIEDDPLSFGILEHYKAKKDGSNSTNSRQESVLSNIVGILQEKRGSNVSASRNDSNVIVSQIIDNLSSNEDVEFAQLHLDSCERTRSLGRRVNQVKRSQSVNSRPELGMGYMQLGSNEISEQAESPPGHQSSELLGDIGPIVRKLI
jgi:hypothetical protein